MTNWQENLHQFVSAGKIPLAIKIGYTVFVSVLVPVYWWYWGAANFLWFSNLALLLGLVAIWLESPRLASMQAVSVGIPEVAWNLDFFVELITGRRLLGMAAYMFREDEMLWVRGLSLFHVVLPVSLIWLVYRLGYDRRAWMIQTLFAWAVLLVCYFFTDPTANTNYVFGPGEKPQTFMQPPLYLLLVMAFLPVCVYLPTHLILRSVMPIRR